MTDPIPARVAALKTMPMPELKAEWRALFETEPPPFNRRYLENRLAYRIQELAYGGLKPETLRRLEILGEQYDSDTITTRRIWHDARPVAILARRREQLEGKPESLQELESRAVQLHAAARELYEILETNNRTSPPKQPPTR